MVAEVCGKEHEIVGMGIATGEIEHGAALTKANVRNCVVFLAFGTKFD